jgi:DNA-binding response OmpR family regulator
MIREIEQQTRNRVPIFAVSASLQRDEEQMFIENGFDGWLLKPIDFRRLNLLLAGVLAEETKREGLYRPEHFNIGGWFVKGADSV